MTNPPLTRRATQHDLLQIASTIVDAYGPVLWVGEVRAILDDAPRDEIPPRIEAAVLAEAVELGLEIAVPDIVPPVAA